MAALVFCISSTSCSQIYYERDEILARKRYEEKKKRKKSQVEMRVTNTAEPIGEFWRKMRHYAYSYASQYFPQHLNWCEQDKIMKIFFIRKLEEKFSGG